MSLKILLIGDDEASVEADRLYLRDRGLHVHICVDTTMMNEVIDEIKPNVVFMNPEEPTEASNEIYRRFLEDADHLHIPVIYTLAEDDVYLVHRKRTAAKAKRNIISDNMIDAIKLALSTPSTKNVSLPAHKKHHLPLHRQAYRA